MTKHYRKLFVIIVFLICLNFLLPRHSAAQESPLFSQEELHQILAPIALYPDALLAQIMMASTYPLEIVQANQWLSANQSLSGDALDSALQEKGWDPSVKALTQFPSVLSMMGQDVEWTTKLGDAFLAQQKNVADTVQALRAKAHAEGNLESTTEQTIVVEKETIIIQSAQPEVIYVPYYNPMVVYGSWYYPAYPPVVVGPPPGTGIIAFSLGVAVGAALDDDWGWHHHHWDWHHGGIDIDIDRNVDIDIDIDHNRNRESKRAREDVSGRKSGDKTGWQHNPEHRQGVAYRDKGTSQRFGQSRSQTRKSRSKYRGYSQPTRAGEKQTPSLTKKRPETGRSQTGSSGAFGGVSRGGSERLASERGQYSRSSASRGASRSGTSGSRRGSSGATRGGGRRR
jgi:hypothetical protein